MNDWGNPGFQVCDRFLSHPCKNIYTHRFRYTDIWIHVLVNVYIYIYVHVYSISCIHVRFDYLDCRFIIETSQMLVYKCTVPYSEM